ncbi:MAG: hypothetical protein O2890_00875 [Cyanobacteria bacterium]|nr:hypothetical protein [Cyanobacteriota bacterium]MDA0864980.1 hypothetical protein [Cyanobacteriota bacterium]
MQGWPGVILGMVVLVSGLSTMGCVGTIHVDTVTPDPPAVAESQPRVTFAGEVPPWADTAAATMAELEVWRGLPFTESLRVTFQPQTDPNLNGWYDSETQQLVVTVGGSEQLGRGVLLHEIFHALQDQHFDLYQLRVQSLDQPDYDQAISALIEGEAMLAVSELLNYNFLAHAQLPPDGEISEERFENLFVYGDGLKFIRAVREAGGWAAVDAAFRDPPQATTLIYHPDRYLAGERQPQPLTIPIKAGETLQSQTVPGEYQVRLLLARSPVTRPLVEAMGDTYGADTLGRVSTADGQVRHRWVITLTDGAAAAELQAGITTALTQHYNLAAPPMVTVVDTTLVAEW